MCGCMLPPALRERAVATRAARAGESDGPSGRCLTAS
jgi:hypothetical protein